MSKRVLLLLAFLSAIFAMGPFALTEDDSDAHLFGTWGGVRTGLAEKGVTLESILTVDSLSNVSGGLSRKSAWLGNYDLTATFDTEKMGLWSGGTLFAYFLGDFGNEISKYSGETQVVDNIEAYSTAKLYEFWYEHSFMDGKFSALVGLHDLNSEFYALDYAGTLINSSFGIGVDVAQVGPSIFSTTSLAVRLKAQPTAHTYALTALYDGVPGDPEKPRGTHIKLKKDDGLFWANELGILSAEGEAHYKAGLGFWYTNPKYADFAEVERTMNRGIYTIGEATLYSEGEESDQGLGAFYQLGFAAGDRNQLSNYFGAGLSYTGLIPSRDEDVFCVGMARAGTSEAYRNSVEESERAETVFEATYRAPITGYLSVQPDFQYVINPSADPSVKDSVVLGVRVELAM